MVAVSEEPVVGPVGRHRSGSARRHGEEVDEKHDEGEDRKAEPVVGDDPVDLIALRQPALCLLFKAALDDLCDVDVSLVGDYALGVVVKLGLRRLDVLFDVSEKIGREFQLFEDLLVALEDLDGVPSLLLLWKPVNGGLLDMRERVLDRTRELVLWDRLSVLRRVYRGLGGLGDTRLLQGGYLDDRTSDLAGQLGQIDPVALLFDQIDHVDRDYDRDPQFGQLGGEIKVSLEVRAVDYVEDGVGSFSYEVVSRDDLLEGVWRERVDAGKVGDDDAVVLFQLSFLFFDGDARPVPDKLIGTGKRVEQRGLSAVGVARKGDPDIHDFCIPFRSTEP